MKEIYEGDVYATKNPTWHEEDAPWKARQIERMIKKHTIGFDTVCEVGCGTGEVLLNLEMAFPNAKLSGYDISPHAFDRAKQKETCNTKFHLADLLEERGSYFDIVLAIDVIEHVEDYVSFVKAVRPFGKYKIFHIPLDLSAQSIVRSWPILQLRSNVGHLHYFYKETALATLRDCGYRVIDHCYTASRLELPNQAFSSRLMRLPRKMMYAVNQDITVRLLGGYSILVLAE
ncbi:methylase [Microvirga sp. KLBC 81]|uniref:class I SAM-dependent methyltransferase n=1 Tax=Microvirga sp. KLBC 81 TaxID=1862707 RepID=UPI000D50AE83|nr:class I SAM-dependent methyltransferase [Microvirga sp. KLBC 81]PVE21805.1 methylase [Microvirga sp. KLBC 81]